MEPCHVMSLSLSGRCLEGGWLDRMGFLGLGLFLNFQRLDHFTLLPMVQCHPRCSATIAQEHDVLEILVLCHCRKLRTLREYVRMGKGFVPSRGSQDEEGLIGVLLGSWPQGLDVSGQKRWLPRPSTLRFPIIVRCASPVAYNDSSDTWPSP